MWGTQFFYCNILGRKELPRSILDRAKRCLQIQVRNPEKHVWQEQTACFKCIAEVGLEQSETKDWEWGSPTLNWSAGSVGWWAAQQQQKKNKKKKNNNNFCSIPWPVGFPAGTKKNLYIQQQVKDALGKKSYSQQVTHLSQTHTHTQKANQSVKVGSPRRDFRSFSHAYPRPISLYINKA